MADARFLIPLLDELDAFEARMRDLAHELVGQIFAAELAERERVERARPRPSAAAARASAGADEELDAGGDAADVTASPTRTSGGPPRRGPWTRDQVIVELATWLLGGNPVEAAFLVRHGHRALVANAKKQFGRFEAALNAANLHLAKQFPEGIPSKKKSAGR